MAFLSLRLAGLSEARARIARWSPSAFVALAEGMIAPIIEDALRQFVHVKTGQTRDSLSAMAAGTHVLGTGNDVAGYLEWGTRPHLIVGHGKMLRFIGRDGQVVFRASVNHPGTAPTLFAEQAAAFAQPAIADAARTAVISVLS